MYYTQPPGVAQQYPNMFDNNLQSPSMYYTCMYYTQPPGVVQRSPSMYYNNLQFPSIYCTCMYYTQPPVSQQVLQRTLTSGHPFPARTTSLPSYAAEEKSGMRKPRAPQIKTKHKRPDGSVTRRSPGRQDRWPLCPDVHPGRGASSRAGQSGTTKTSRIMQPGPYLPGVRCPSYRRYVLVVTASYPVNMPGPMRKRFGYGLL